ncbi:bifunctional adenosylcobinamide kinase/adenosylcobinamide-phosphate guanylyltransferase [Shewanella sp. KT0246]|uniref:bifunctional adenosylcobinamide kinase/adenosylcobinamide-phosphate guanylyltransferase n=1 Tax=Shewanella sp. KT0246 TaxID=2815912 RepID=UPI001BBFA006|nr:bifunctional adenosylcobinamide kinase/adenosylcobinamide-phosphate guanylyltransferase [Shewanella sp. KT0246]GIU48482.1 bifunctional adenosylcobinamide kinase/adenosylcobinamide-phosphate guanylyltransferase [Shewanella sp. KT0246]
MKQLIIGGARSGKSKMAQQYAKQWQQQTQGDVIVIATAQHDDSSMKQRIAHHQQNRPKHWQTVETHLQLAEAITQYSTKGNLILVDCLTLWLSNTLMFAANQKDSSFDQMKQQLLDAINASTAELVLISNEVGQGVVPLGELSREFVDQSGWLHQSLSQYVDQVAICIAGLPLVLKEAK